MSPVLNLPVNEQLFVDTAVREWRALKSGREWNSWIKVGVALQMGARAAMFAAETNARAGRRYNMLFSEWCREQGFGDMPSSLRSRLLWLVDEPTRSHAEQLRATWSVNDRMKRSHPMTMYKYLMGHIEGPSAPKPVLSRPVTEVDNQPDEVDPDAVVRHWLSSRSVEQMAALLCDGLDQEKWDALVDATYKRKRDASKF